MKLFIPILLSLNTLLCSCQSKHTYSPEIIKKNNEATDLYIRANGNADSIKRAVQLLKEVIMADSSFEGAYLNLAQYLTVLGQPSEALTVIVQAQKHSPEDPQLCFIQGVLEEKLNKTDVSTHLFINAIAGYEKQLKEKSDDVNLQINKIFIMCFVNGKTSALKELDCLAGKYKSNTKERIRIENAIKMMSGFERQKFIAEFWAQ